MLTLTLITSLLLTQTSTQIVDGTVTTRKAAVTSGNAVKVEMHPATVSTATNSGTCANVGTSSSTLVSANTNRKALYLVAHGANTARVHIKLGTTATTSNAPLEAGQSFNLDTVIYTGRVDAISASGTQSVCVVEL